MFKTESIVGLQDVSACVFIQRANGQILGVSRKEDHHDWGLPGGKMEAEDERDPRRCAARELFEETGVSVDPTLLMPVFQAPARTPGRVAITYYADIQKADYANIQLADSFPVYGVDSHRVINGASVAWVSWPHLLTGSFAAYHKCLGVALDLREQYLVMLLPLVRLVIAPPSLPMLMPVKEFLTAAERTFNLPHDDVRQLLSIAIVRGAVRLGPGGVSAP